MNPNYSTMMQQWVCSRPLRRTPVSGRFSVGEGQRVRLAQGNVAKTIGTRCGRRQEYYGGWFSHQRDYNRISTHIFPYPNWTAILDRRWRLLGAAEWRYLLEDRPRAAEKRGLATVCGMPGLVLLPDACEVRDFDTRLWDWSDNRYGKAEWKALERKGVVLLPATGHRSGGRLFNYLAEGWYWTGFSSSSLSVCAVHFAPEKVEVVEVTSYGILQMPLRLAMDDLTWVPDDGMAT